MGEIARKMSYVDLTLDENSNVLKEVQHMPTESLIIDLTEDDDDEPAEKKALLSYCEIDQILGEVVEISFPGTSTSLKHKTPSKLPAVNDPGVQAKSKILARRRSEMGHLETLESLSYVPNIDIFECPICMTDVKVGGGVTLKNCIHSFCKLCLIETIKYCEEPLVKCPFMSAFGSCDFNIQDREIRAIVPEEVYQIHLSVGLKQAENIVANVFHCKTLDCFGFIENEGATAFVCSICDKVNCLKCEAIHEDLTCQQFQDNLKNDAKNQADLKETEEAVKAMLSKGTAMLCPQCNVVIQKDEGCDYVLCRCKLALCYRTKKPRHDFTKTMSDGTKVILPGCGCQPHVKKCDPKCGNCH